MRSMNRWLRKELILPAAAVYALFAPMTGAQAALVTYSFTGSLDPSYDPDGEFPVSGSFQFNNNTSGRGGVHHGAVTGFILNIGDHTSSFAEGANAIMISKNIPLNLGNGDRWALVAAAGGDDILSDGTVFRPFSFDLRFELSGGGLTNMDLQNPPGLNGGVSGRWRLLFDDENRIPGAYVGSISNLTLTAVPLPAAVLLFGAGLISLVGLGAGGLRNLRDPRA